METGWTMKRVASAYDVLMRRLGYDSYGVHGSDGGAMVGRESRGGGPGGLPRRARAAPVLVPVGRPGRVRGLRAEGVRRAGAHAVVPVGRRLQLHERHPSPDRGRRSGRLPGRGAGLQRACSRAFGNGTSLVTPEQVLAQATLYWLTNTYGSAARYHYEEQHAGAEPVVSTGRIGVAVFKDDFQTIRSLAERDNAGITHWSEHPRGGHFAAMEVPEDVVADLRVFFATA
ncbi:hypothetical protein [Nocardioides convexus]|uniref:hypothetical protein n=1 Tax=Nocardioides convexus TaxID=2712224 RepID=UPI002418A5D6|nr:hypothetical protein [Nocardioides convexus]